LRRKMYDTKCIMSIEKKIIINRGWQVGLLFRWHVGSTYYAQRC
jgi:hypothetical protein